MPLVASVPSILSDLGVAIVVAALLAFLARLLKQPLLLAYVAAGVVLGPSMGFSVITSAESVEAISSLGLILLLYLIGLEIDVRAIRRSGRAVLLAGLLQLPINAILCLAVPAILDATGLLGPLGRYGTLYLAFGLSISSTLVVVKVLYDKFELDTLPGRITLGVLVFQDLWSILFLAAQPSLSDPEVLPLLRSFGLGITLVVGAFSLARYVLPWVFKTAARVPELMVLGAIAWCFLVAGLASKAGLSAEMGALTAGLAMSCLPYKADVVAKVATVRDFFLTLFFVALGLKVAAPTSGLGLAAFAIAAFVLLTRFLVMVPLLRALRAGDRAALVVSMNLWPVSEFTLVLTAIGLKLGHVESVVLDLILFTMIVSAVLGTYLMTASHAVYLRLRRLFERRGWAGAECPADVAGPCSAQHSIVLLGFHRIASAFLHDLAERHPELLDRVLVVDFNPLVLDELRRRKVACAYGDLGNPDTLHHMGLEHANVAVITVPDTLLKGTTNRRILGHVRHIAPQARVIATAETAAGEAALLADGAAAVLVAPRAAGVSVLADVLALHDGRPAPSAESAVSVRDEVLR
ncbi:MAG TPA: cation:proton antiporter [Planctomycetota bacterium]|nr:cation:proton antiporter [Planctomycetota bacterium]